MKFVVSGASVDWVYWMFQLKGVLGRFHRSVVMGISSVREVNNVSMRT